MDVWDWVVRLFVPIFVSPWYNGRAPSKAEDALIMGRSSALVGMARIRQLRVKTGKMNSKAA